MEQLALLDEEGDNDEEEVDNDTRETNEVQFHKQFLQELKRKEYLDKMSSEKG